MKYIHKILVICVIFFILISCNKDDADQNLIDFCIANIYVPDEATDFNNFLINRAKFSCYNAEHYSFIYKFKSGGCFNSEVYIEVINEMVVKAEDVFIDEFSISGNFCRPESIEEIFDIISVAVDKNIEIPQDVSLCDPQRFPFATTCQIADRVNIDYDDTFGFPTSMHIDYNLGWADEEFTIELSQFEIIN